MKAGIFDGRPAESALQNNFAQLAIDQGAGCSKKIRKVGVNGADRLKKEDLIMKTVRWAVISALFLIFQAPPAVEYKTTTQTVSLYPSLEVVESALN